MSKTNTYIPALITIACTGALLFYLKKNKTIMSKLDGNFFADKEFTRSATADKLGISNEPDEAAWQRLYALRDNILNPARKLLGRAIHITSGYRSPELNAAVGGAANSQHVTGEAVDISTRNRTANQRLFATLVSLGNFDQLIWEKGGEWIHVSHKADAANRGQMLAYDGSKYYNINNNWQNAIA